MNLERLQAEGVFGYLKFDIKFNEDITFLTGINGCGKTTALRLLLALTTPSLRELDLIPHARASVHVRSDSGKFTIQSQSDNESMTIRVSEVKEPLIFPRIDIRRYEDRPNALERIEEHYSVIEEKLEEHPVVRFLTKIDTPTFLGLERRQQLSDMHQRELVRDPRTGRVIGRRPTFRGTLGASLWEIQQLVQDFFRGIRRRQDQLSDRLKQDILLSSFDYTPFGKEFRLDDLRMPQWRQRELIDKKHAEVEATLQKLGIEADRYKEQIDKFFSQLGDLAVTPEDTQSPKFLEWVVNKPQVDRIEKIFRIVDEYNNQVTRLLSPIENFLSLVNKFLNDSGKKLDIDSVGYLVVAIKDQPPQSIEALSSGERQILVMLAHLSISERTKRPGVFIVDEPELSLHLKWQEIFVDSILEAGPSTQFILATHAPGIVLDRESKFVTLGG